MKLAFYLYGLALGMAWPLYSQISTGQSGSSFATPRTVLSLKLDWNKTGGFDGTVSQVDPITGVVLETITGSGTVQSRHISVEFPGHGNFQGRMSKDRSVINGRLIFREAFQARPVVRRFKLYAYGPTTGTGTVGLTIRVDLGSVSSGDLDWLPGATNTNIVVEVPAP